MKFVFHPESRKLLPTYCVFILRADECEFSSWFLVNFSFQKRGGESVKPALKLAFLERDPLKTVTLRSLDSFLCDGLLVRLVDLWFVVFDLFGLVVSTRGAKNSADVDPEGAVPLQRLRQKAD